jgi:predicted secreted hydrolase
MKSSHSILCLVAAVLSIGALWQPALPGYKFAFPRDHFMHPDYKTEWWYYTGNLQTKEGRRFGYELTFFRAGLDPQENSTPVWRTDSIWLAHLALTDIEGKKFFHTERMNRTGPGLAGASLKDGRYWNGNWQVRWQTPDGKQSLQAVSDGFTLQLQLRPEKPSVINGRGGISQKGPQRGQASHYISFTRLSSSGYLTYEGMRFDLTGATWMDHEFFTEQQDNSFGGWDWFAIQLDNKEELMLYRLRLKSGTASPYSSGTFVAADGNTKWLSSTDFTLQPGRNWHSAESGASYPIAWGISVPKLQLQLRETTPLESQELFRLHSVTPTYWEGAADYTGTQNGRPTRGVGYLEMTGYGKQMRPIF